VMTPIRQGQPKSCQIKTTEKIKPIGWETRLENSQNLERM